MSSTWDGTTWHAWQLISTFGMPRKPNTPRLDVDVGQEETNPGDGLPKAVVLVVITTKHPMSIAAEAQRAQRARIFGAQMQLLILLVRNSNMIVIQFTGRRAVIKKRNKWTPTNSNQYLQPQLLLPLAAKSLTHQISRAVMHLDLGKDSSSGFGFGGRTWPHGPIPSNTIHTTVDVYCSTTLVVMSHILRVILGHCYCSLQGVFMVMTRTMVCSLSVLPPCSFLNKLNNKI